MKLLQYDLDRIMFIYSDDNSKNLIGRISIKIDSPPEPINGIQDQSDIISIIKNINNDLLNNIIVKGISNISNILISEKSKFTINDEKITTNIKNNFDINEIKKPILITDGLNLLEEALVQHPNVTQLPTLKHSGLMMSGKYENAYEKIPIFNKRNYI